MINEKYMEQFERESKKNMGKRIIGRFILAELRKHGIRRKARNTPNAYGSDTNTEWRCLLEEISARIDIKRIESEYEIDILPFQLELNAERLLIAKYVLPPMQKKEKVGKKKEKGY